MDNAPAGPAGLLLRPARPGDAAAIDALLRAEHLDTAFDAAEFLVADQDGTVVACGRLKPLPDGTHEIASVAVVPALRGQGVGAVLVRRLLTRARGPIVALALAPGFFEWLGFRPMPDVPETLREKAAGQCKSKPFVPMAWP